ncbi:MAG: hypothetical protein HY909_09265 [Deltaproteobacteria bacterium]|nr:hypothetical protein [Deltaproteobacteria bacterium]
MIVPLRGFGRATDGAEALRAALAVLADGGPPRGTIYLEPGRWTLRSSVVVPEQVTLWLAPGAVLQPAEGVELRLEGALRAPPSRIFALRPETRDAFFGRAPAPGTVSFGGRRPRVFRPEWWGVGLRTEAPEDAWGDADALEACILAALGATEAGVAPPEVYLGGRYDLQRTVRLSRRTGQASGLRLRGNRGSSAVTTVSWKGDGGSATAMLEVDGRLEVALEDLVLDARRTVGACVRVRRRVEAEGAPAARSLTIRRCALLGATANALDLDAPEGVPGAFSGVVVEGCVISPALPRAPLGKAAGVAVGAAVRVSAAWGGPVALTGSHFTGPAASLLDLGGAQVSVLGCGFFNSSSLDRSSERPRGVDVLHRATSLLASASLSLTHCESYSPCFLYSAPVPGREEVDGVRGNVVLVAIVQAPQAPVLLHGEPTTVWGSITWSAFLRHGVMFPTLTLLGCAFRWDVELSSGAPTVLDLGSRFGAAGGFRHMLDAIGIVRTAEQRDSGTSM